MATSSNHTSGAVRALPSGRSSHGFAHAGDSTLDSATSSRNSDSGADQAPDAACSSGACRAAASRVRRRWTHSARSSTDARPRCTASMRIADLVSSLGATRAASTAARAGDDSRIGPRVTTASSWSRVRRTSAKPLRRLLEGRGHHQVHPLARVGRRDAVLSGRRGTRQHRAVARPEQPGDERCRGRGVSRERTTTWGRSTRQDRPLIHRTAAGETPWATSWARVATPSWRARRASSSVENSGTGPSVAACHSRVRVTREPVDTGARAGGLWIPGVTHLGSGGSHGLRRGGRCHPPRYAHRDLACATAWEVE